MAVQKSKCTRAARGMRRSHDGLKSVSLSVDKETGETHRRHHLTADGYYRGRQVIDTAELEESSEDTTE